MTRPDSPSPWLYGVMLGVWTGILAISLPFFRRLVLAADTTLIAGIYVVFLGALAVFWLLGLYNITVTLFGTLYTPNAPDGDYTDYADADVAILYPTYNDFSPYHLDRSRTQSHEQTHTYIVDDSTDEAVVAEIDAYAAQYDDVSVVRREGREGFKAGAINHALETSIDEPYFALLDADEVLPDDFIEATLPYFDGEDIAFVQGNHDYNRETATKFGRALGIGVDIHWDIYQPVRNTFGFVMLLGHGALIRRDVVLEIGGFPELVSEDLAFATRAREHGYRGVFASDVDCLEDFPVDYEAFRERHKKWTAGSIEYITEELPRFLRADDVPLVEKLDVLIPTLQLPLTAVFVAYIVLVGLLTALTGSVIPESVVIPWHQGVITAATILSPMYCYIIGLRRRPRKLVHFLATSTMVYCSVAITAVAYGAKTLLPWERAEFLTTPKDASSDLELRPYAWTLAAGLLGMVIASQAGALVGTAASTWVLAPLVALFNDDSLRGRFARRMTLLPFCLLAVGVGYGVVSMLSLF